MHILLGILAALGAIAWFVIRANQVNRAGREIMETASDAKALIRRSRWKSKGKGDLIQDIADPRLAAAVMMTMVAKCDGDVTERQRDAIQDQMEAGLGLEPQAASEMLAEARWRTNDVNDVTTVLRRAAPTIESNCTAEERLELIDMLVAVAGVEGAVSDLQTNAIDGLKRKLGLTP